MIEGHRKWLLTVTPCEIQKISYDFSEILRSYPLLCEHIHSALKKDVPYVSPTSQYELTDITAKDMIQDN